MQLGALLQREGGVRVQEAETIAADLQLGEALLAVPVLVTATTQNIIIIVCEAYQ